MVDPISSIQSRAVFTSELIESRQSKESERSNSAKSSSSAKSSLKSALTSSLTSSDASLQLSSGINLNEIRMTGEVLMEKVSAALQQKFGVKTEDLPSAPEDLPEDASASEILDYFSPEKTAQRILNFSTNFFNAYLQNHQGEENSQQVEGFVQLIGQAIEDGFNQAEQALGGNFDNLGETGDTIKKTYDLVMEGLQKFREDKLVLMGETIEEDTTQTVQESPSDEITQAAHDQLDITA